MFFKCDFNMLLDSNKSSMDVVNMDDNECKRTPHGISLSHPLHLNWVEQVMTPGTTSNISPLSIDELGRAYITRVMRRRETWRNSRSNWRRASWCHMAKRRMNQGATFREESELGAASSVWWHISCELQQDHKLRWKCDPPTSSFWRGYGMNMIKPRIVVHVLTKKCFNAKYQIVCPYFATQYS